MSEAALPHESLSQESLSHTGHQSGGWTPAQVGMLSFLISEAAFFSTLILAYSIYLGQDTSGPTPSDALSLPLVIVNSVFLLSSSGTIAFALRAREHRNHRGYALWMFVTILLGGLFLAGTGFEWYDLIFNKGLTISRNLFGSTFFTLIGFHGAHVSIGMLAMTIITLLNVRGHLPQESAAPELISWYWHFVDGVWIAIFCLVYVLGR